MVDMVLSILIQGLIFGILALGSYISYRILNFPDLSVEGTFPLGAAVTAVLILKGMNPFLVCLAAMVAGCLGGIVTGLIHVKLKITDLLSGIITLTALYSVNLIWAGRANLPIFGEANKTIFSAGIFGVTDKLFISFVICVVAKIALDLFLKTRLGYLVKAGGDNVHFVTSLAKDVGFVKILGLCLANGLAALSGSVYCQYQQYFDVGMGRNMIIIGLSSVIIGTNIFRRVKFMKGTTMSILGCFIYNACVAAAIAVNIGANYMNLVIAALFLASLVLNGRSGGRRKQNA